MLSNPFPVFPWDVAMHLFFKMKCETSLYCLPHFKIEEQERQCSGCFYSWKEGNAGRNVCI